MLSYNKILVPIDFAKISESAVIKAANHSEASNSQLLLAYILDPAQSGHDTTGDGTDAIAQAGARVDELLDRLEIGYCERLIEVGDTVATLLQIIEREGIDLVVMGTHHRERPAELVKSITAAVVSGAECDVLVLHR